MVENITIVVPLQSLYFVLIFFSPPIVMAIILTTLYMNIPKEKDY